MVSYFFGVYHWRHNIGSIVELFVSIALVTVGVMAIPSAVALTALIGLPLFVHAVLDMRKLFKPHPWRVDQHSFETLARHLPLDAATSIMELGCGTGRSFVGLAPYISCESDVIGVDRFDGRIIVGNSPRLAKRNARQAGLSVDVTAADATKLPFKTDSIDVVTISQVLHDLSESEANAILEDTYRVCKRGGVIGLIEHPLVADERFVSPEHWRESVEEAGFSIEHIETTPWKNETETTILTAVKDEARSDFQQERQHDSNKNPAQ